MKGSTGKVYTYDEENDAMEGRIAGYTFADDATYTINGKAATKTTIRNTDYYVVSIQAAAAPVTYILGDADGDEDVSSVDVTLIQRYCADFVLNIPEETLLHGDVDDSGDLDILDVTLIQRYLADFNVQYPIGEWV